MCAEGRLYGIEEFARLRTVMVHQPRSELYRVGAENYTHLLFDALPDIERFREEHAQYVQILRAHNVEVLELADYVTEHRDLIDDLPNLCYLHDSSVISRRGFILSKMSFAGRQREEVVVKEALTTLGIPSFHEFEPDDDFEGCLLFAPDLLFVAKTERHSVQSIERFLPRALELVPEVIYVEIPAARRFMHPDMVLNRVREDLALAYLPAFLHSWRITRDTREAINFPAYMTQRGVELLNVSDDEQQRWATSFVPLEPGTIIHYDIALSAKTRRELARRNVTLIEFHPDALLAGGGSLRCLTLRVWRASPE